jgi:hypothetical protein
MAKAIAFWLGCVCIGAALGFLIGWIIWQLGFEIIGSSVAIVGAGFGGLFVLYMYLKRTEAF